MLIRAEIFKSQVALLLGRNFWPTLGGILFSLSTTLLFWNFFSTRALATAFCAKFITAFLRLAAGYFYKRNNTALTGRQWANLYLILLALDALCWAGISIYFVPADHPEFIAGGAAVIIGVGAVGTSVLSNYFPAHAVFSSFLLLPAALWNFFLQGHPFATVAGLGLVLFYALILLDGKRSGEGFSLQMRLQLTLDQSLAALRESEDRWRVLSEFTPVPTYVWEEKDGDWELISYNKAAKKFSGDRVSALLGAKASVLFADTPEILGAIAECKKTGTARQENLDYKIFPTGELKVLHITYGFIPEKYVLVTAEDVTDKVRIERALRQSLHEKEMLLAEVHHRVKNNLQVLTSLISMQSQLIDDKVSLIHLGSLGLRVRAMGLLHTKLYESPDLARVDMKDYLTAIAKQVVSVQWQSAGDVQVKIDVEEIHLNMETSLPLGLIANEIISNSLKYAFAETQEPVITISLKAMGKSYSFRIADNGCGLPAKPQTGNTLGLRLVEVLTRQLHATLEIESGAGAAFKIIFNEQKKEERRWQN